MAGFGYADPNIPCPPRVNNPQPCLPCPQQYVSPPPEDQEANAESSPSESSDAEEGDSLKANQGLP